jgi:hypothetical protein
LCGAGNWEDATDPLFVNWTTAQLALQHDQLMPERSVLCSSALGLQERGTQVQVSNISAVIAADVRRSNHADEVFGMHNG